MLERDHRHFGAQIFYRLELQFSSLQYSRLPVCNRRINLKNKWSVSHLTQLNFKPLLPTFEAMKLQKYLLFPFPEQ